MQNQKPLIAINFKTYESATGDKAVDLAKICDETAKEVDANVIVCVEASDIHLIQSEVSIPVYAQHVDGVDFGSHTGKILAESLKDNGASGTLLNHSLGVEIDRTPDFLASSILSPKIRSCNPHCPCLESDSALDFLAPSVLSPK